MAGMLLLFCQLDLGYACLLFAFNMLRDDKKSIVLVITPLTAIMKDQVRQN